MALFCPRILSVQEHRLFRADKPLVALSSEALGGCFLGSERAFRVPAMHAQDRRQGSAYWYGAKRDRSDHNLAGVSG